jgi:hypothetical protein
MKIASCSWRWTPPAPFFSWFMPYPLGGKKFSCVGTTNRSQVS